MKLQKIADLVGGTIQGDAAQEISGVNGIEFAQAGDITYCTDKKLEEKLQACKASAVLVSAPLDLNIAQVIHPNPPLAFAKILAVVRPNPRPEPGVPWTSLERVRLRCSVSNARIPTPNALAAATIKLDRA